MSDSFSAGCWCCFEIVCGVLGAKKSWNLAFLMSESEWEFLDCGGVLVVLWQG